MIEIVPDGDALFKVGTGKGALDIRVSGLVVSLASEVFSRMLSSRFIEGLTKTITLPEDDPKTMLTFCQIIHHKVNDIEDVGGLGLRDQICKLIVMADMRKCGPSLQPWVLSKISPVLKEDGPDWNNLRRSASPFREMWGNMSVEDMIYVTAVLKHKVLFHRITKLAVILSNPNNKEAESPRNLVIPSLETPNGDEVQGKLCFQSALKPCLCIDLFQLPFKRFRTPIFESS